MTEFKNSSRNKRPKGGKDKFTSVKSGDNYSRDNTYISAEVADIRSLMQAVNELLNQNKLASRLNASIANNSSALKQAHITFPEFGSQTFFAQLIKLFKCIMIGKIDGALPEQIQIALRNCAHIFLQTIEAPWQLVLIPVIHQDKFLTVSCYLKDTDFLPPTEEDGQITYKRLLIEFEHDRYQKVLIEGMYSQECVNKLHLVIKTVYPIPEAKENQIRELFKKISEASNLCGGISFLKLTGDESNPFSLIARHYCLSKIASLEL